MILSAKSQAGMIRTENDLTLILAILGPNPPLTAAIGDVLKSMGFQIRPEVDAETQAVVVDDPDPAAIAGIREKDETVPILALSSAAVDGADATLVKPVRAHVIASQVALLVERNGQRIGNWRFFPKIRRLKAADGQVEHLTAKESELLNYLLCAGGLVSRDEILADVFGYSTQVSTHTLETHIHTLRKKLGADLVVTEEDGYRLTEM